MPAADFQFVSRFRHLAFLACPILEIYRSNYYAHHSEVSAQLVLLILHFIYTPLHPCNVHYALRKGFESRSKIWDIWDCVCMWCFVCFALILSNKSAPYDRTLTVALAQLPLLLLMSFFFSFWKAAHPFQCYNPFVRLFWCNCSSTYPCCKWITALRHVPNSIQTSNCQISFEKTNKLRWNQMV